MKTLIATLAISFALTSGASAMSKKQCFDRGLAVYEKMARANNLEALPVDEFKRQGAHVLKIKSISDSFGAMQNFVLWFPAEAGACEIMTPAQYGAKGFDFEISQVEAELSRAGVR